MEYCSSIMNINTMLANESDRFLDKLAQLLMGIQDNPRLREVFQLSMAPNLVLDSLSSAAVTSIVSPQDDLVPEPGPRGTVKTISVRGLQSMHKALEIDHILEHIFSYCPVASLKECRLVSTRWRDLSFKLWRKYAVFCISDGEDDEEDVGFLSLHELNSILNSIQAGDADAHRLLQKPFKSYSLQYLWAGVGDNVNSPKYQNLIQQFGHHVKYLELNAYASWRDVITLVFVKFRNVTHLRFNGGVIVDPYDFVTIANTRPLEHLEVLEMRKISLWLSFPWTDFLRRFPNVQQLALSFDNSTNAAGEAESKQQLRNALYAIRTLRKESAKVLNLTELDILEYHSCPVAHVAGGMPAWLGRCKLVSLERFSVDLGATTHPVNISKLLTPLSPKLKYLRLTRGLDEETYGNVKVNNVRTMKQWKDVRIRLEQLEELRFLNGLCWAFHLLAFMDVPKLEKVVFEWELEFKREADGDDARMLGKEFKEVDVVHIFLLGKTFPQIVTFEYQPHLLLLTSRDMQALAKAMPNLKHLAMALSAETFRDVCRLWPRLRSLDVRKSEADFPEIDDETITGFRGRRMVSALLPNVTCLQELTDLIISCERGLRETDVKFTDHSVVYGFLTLPRLHYLSIAFRWLSKKTRAALEGHVHYLHLQ